MEIHFNKVLVRGLREGVDLAFYDTKVWTHYQIRIPAVMEETSFLKSASSQIPSLAAEKSQNIDVAQQYLTPT